MQEVYTYVLNKTKGINSTFRRLQKRENTDIVIKENAN